MGSLADRCGMYRKGYASMRSVWARSSGEVEE